MQLVGLIAGFLTAGGAGLWPSSRGMVVQPDSPYGRRAVDMGQTRTWISRPGIAFDPPVVYSAGPGPSGQERPFSFTTGCGIGWEMPRRPYGESVGYHAGRAAAAGHAFHYEGYHVLCMTSATGECSPSAGHIWRFRSQ